MITVSDWMCVTSDAVAEEEEKEKEANNAAGTGESEEIKDGNNLRIWPQLTRAEIRLKSEMITKTESLKKREKGHFKISSFNFGVLMHICETSKDSLYRIV